MLAKITRATRRREPDKWRQICWNSLVTICNFDLANVGQGHRVRLSQLLHSMTNIKIAVSEIFEFEICDIEKIGQGRGERLSQCSPSNVKIYESRDSHFCANSDGLWHITISNIWPWKCGTSKVNEYNLCIRWQILKSINDFCLLFALSCASSDCLRDINSTNLWLWKKCRWRSSTTFANGASRWRTLKTYKSGMPLFCAITHRFRDLK